MKLLPFYLNDSIMPIYRTLLVLAFLLGFSSLLVGLGFAIFTYASTELSFSTSAYHGLILFLKGAGLSALFGFIGFYAFWKRHHILYENCRKSHTAEYCGELGFFNFA